MCAAPVLAVVLALSPDSAFSQSPRQHAQQAAGAATGATGAVKSPQGQLGTIVPGYQTSNPQNLTRHYDQEGALLEGATLEKLGQANDGAGGEVGTAIINGYTMRPDINVTRDESWLSQARGTLANPDLIAGDLFTTNQNPACRPTHVGSTPFEIRSCDTFGSPEERSCGLGVEIDVLAEKTYACFRETETYRKRCDEELTARCTEVLSNCRLEDGLISTAADDLQISYGNFRHRARLPNMDYGSCRTISRSFTVFIEDKSKLATARFSRIEHQGGLNVYVNGTFVWGGPYGGGGIRHELGWWRFSGWNPETHSYPQFYGLGRPIPVEDGLNDPPREYLGDCKQDTPSISTPGVNIRPEMKTGVNTITFELIVGDVSGFDAEFQFLMSCCGNWEETWERTCPY